MTTTRNRPTPTLVWNMTWPAAPAPGPGPEPTPVPEPVRVERGTVYRGRTVEVVARRRAARRVAEWAGVLVFFTLVVWAGWRIGLVLAHW